MKTHLRDNYYCEGFNNSGDLGHQCFSFAAYHLNQNIIYSGKTSEIPEEIAKEVAKFCFPFDHDYTKLYKDYRDEGKIGHKTAKESIQSALTKQDGSVYKFCIIYKA